MSTQVAHVETDIDYPRLERDLRSPRTLFSSFMSVLTALMTLAAMVPLFSVLWTLLVNGGRHLSLALFTQLPPAPMEAGGGFGNAILGTLLMVGIASLLSVPFGILAAIYLAEIGPTTRTAGAVRTAAKVLTGLPSILAGVFAYAVVVVTTGHFSALAGGVALGSNSS
jgi:phosphate transport system permease protein